MESVSYDYKGINFNNIMKAFLRKYLDEVYKDKNVIVDISHKLLSKHILEIYRVHSFEIFWTLHYFVERILINRKNKTAQSWITSFNYHEECNYSQIEGGVRYVQKFRGVPFFLKGNKIKLFHKGCEVMEKIIDKLNLRRYEDY